MLSTPPARIRSNFTALDAARKQRRRRPCWSRKDDSRWCRKFPWKTGEKKSHAARRCDYLPPLDWRSRRRRHPASSSRPWDFVRPGFDGNGGKVIGSYGCKRAAVSSDGRANGVTNEGKAHGFCGLSSFPVYRKRAPVDQIRCFFRGRALDSLGPRQPLRMEAHHAHKSQRNPDRMGRLRPLRNCLFPPLFRVFRRLHQCALPSSAGLAEGRDVAAVQIAGIPLVQASANFSHHPRLEMLSVWNPA